MARSIRIEGPAKYVLLGVALFLRLGGWLASDLLSQVVGSSGRGYGFLRGGYVE